MKYIYRQDCVKSLCRNTLNDKGGSLYALGDSKPSSIIWIQRFAKMTDNINGKHVEVYKKRWPRFTGLNK